jgi:hypothetical protein
LEHVINIFGIEEYRKQETGFYQLCAGFMLRLFVDLDDGSDMFFSSGR